ETLPRKEQARRRGAPQARRGCRSPAARDGCEPSYRGEDRPVVADLDTLAGRDDQKLALAPVTGKEALEDTCISVERFERPAAPCGFVLRLLLEAAIGLEAIADVGELRIRLLVRRQLFVKVAAVVLAVLLNQRLQGVGGCGRGLRMAEPPRSCSALGRNSVSIAEGECASP